MLTLTLKSGKTIKVSANPGNKPAPWQPSGRHYRVTLKVDGQKIGFNFWDSAHNFQNHKPADLRGAVACFASDAMTGRNASDALDIMEKFGYTEPREARRVFKGVKRADEQAQRLDLSDDDLSELADF